MDPKKRPLFANGILNIITAYQYLVAANFSFLDSDVIPPEDLKKLEEAIQNLTFFIK